MRCIAEYVVPNTNMKAQEQSDLRLEYVVLLFLFGTTYSAMHLISWANVRYRLPVDAVLILFAGYGLANLGSWMFKPKPAAT